MMKFTRLTSVLNAKTVALAALAVAGSLAFSAPAEAWHGGYGGGLNIAVGVPVGGYYPATYPYYVYQPPVVYAPPPGYVVAPAPVYAAPAPGYTYSAPAPAYVAPAR